MDTSAIQRAPHNHPQRRRLAVCLTAAACIAASDLGSAGEIEAIATDLPRSTPVDSSSLQNAQDGESVGAGLSLSSRIPAKVAADHIDLLAGYRPPDPGECGDYEVGPLDAKELSAKEFWLSLISPYVKIFRFRERQDTRPDVLANMRFGEEVMDFSIERATRRVVIDKFPFKFGFLPNGGRELIEVETNVGPIRGRMTINDALRIFIGSDDLMIRWYNEPSLDPPVHVSVVPLYREKLLAESGSACNFGYKELEKVTVAKPRLPSLTDEVAAPAEVFDRERIERTGVASLPELLRYATQTAFTRSAGYRLNGAQYAEGRGVGPAMVLIEGQRTMASASSLQDSAFDLNTIPLSAIERVEVIPDRGSILYGVDALGGIVNVVLRKPSEQITSEARYGAARGGAIERRLTALARTEGPALDAVIIADQLEVTNLLGHERTRYANQNYTRYAGGMDRRSITSEQGNLQLKDTIVGLPSANGREHFDPSELTEHNLTSLLRYQSVSPSRRRASLVASAKTSYDLFEVSGNAIYTRQDTRYTLPPPSVIAGLVSSQHPQNSLQEPVLYYGLLSGLPSQQYETGTELFRSAFAFSTRAAGWTWELSLAYTQETYSDVLLNSIDPIALEAALDTADPRTALRFFDSQPGAGRFDLLAPNLPERFEAIASHAHVMGQREFNLFPAGEALVQFGADWRKESIDFAGVDPNATRDASGSYLNVRVPILAPLVISAGARNDHYSDGDSILSGQLGLEWRPTANLKVHGDYGERYRPPSLYELHATSMPFDIPVTDPKTGQTTVATVVQGGRQGLKPTTATSSGLGITLSAPKDFDLSVYYWQLHVRDRISILPLQTTLEYEDYLPGSVIRESPGNAIRLIDIGWQNLGETDAAGIDLKLRNQFRIWGGTLSSEVGLTWNTHYSYRDLPAAVGSASDRVGIASELGTVLRHRGAAEFAWENNAWRIVANITEHPRYRDIRFDSLASTAISSQTLLDLNVSRRWGASSLSIGMFNAFDSEPGYSNASIFGYDPSQGDLRGRFVYGELRIGF